MTELNGIRNKLFRNWAETFSCEPEFYFEPDTVETLKEILKLAHQNKKKIKVVGCGHSPSDLACTQDYMISLKKFDKIIDIDQNNLQVKVESGITIEKMNKILTDNNLAFSVLGSISGQTIAGAISAAFHGTGGKFPVLSDYVTEVEMLLASGEVKTYSKTSNSNEFSAVLCSLGCLGIILTVKIQCEKSFNLEQIEYGANFEEILETLDTHINSSDHFRINWFPHTDYAICYHASRTMKKVSRQPKNWFRDIFLGYFLLEFLYWLACFCSLIIPKINLFYYKLFSEKKVNVDLSYQIFNFDCLFKQYAFEAAIPRKETSFYLLKLKKWLENNPNVKVHIGVEIRFTKGDDIWLSPCYNQDSCYINILMFKPYGKDFSRQEWWDINESLMKECNGRPHWAKTHTLGREDFIKLYPKFVEFDNLRKKLDPTDIFLNKCLEQVFN